MFEMQDGERGSRGSQSDKRGLETLSIVFLTAHDSKIKKYITAPSHGCTIRSQKINVEKDQTIGSVLNFLIHHTTMIGRK